MNLFIAAQASEGQADGHALESALRQLLERLPFFPGRPVHRWRSPGGDCAFTWVTHDPAQTGGISYAHDDGDRFVLFAGRPFRWRREGVADGRGALEPARYLEPFERWLRVADGRFAIARYVHHRLEVATDRLGAYPLFETELGGVRCVSNSAEALRLLDDQRECSSEVLASLLGGGWSLTGDPLWAGIRRVEGPGRLTPGELATLAGTGFDAERAAATLTAAVRALDEWPGRPSSVPVTGGRDSRLVLAAATAAGIAFETLTGGVDGQPDVEIGRALADAVGAPHSLIPDDPHGSITSDWRRGAQLLELTCAGTASLSDAAGFPFGPRDGALPLWHSGQGGEIARSYYGSGDGLDRNGLADRLYRRFTGRRPGRSEMLSDVGRRLVRDHIERFVDERLAAGVRPGDVPDLFYLERRMGTWAGPSHGAVEYVRDTTSPLWSHRLLRDELGLAADERARELFHARVLERLAPQLAAIPYEDGSAPGASEGGLARRVRRASALAGKAGGELRRRVAPGAGRRPAGDDHFARALPEIREAVLSQPDHAAWPLLDRARVEQLLSSSPRALDTMSRYYVWRLATVFGPRA